MYLSNGLESVFVGTVDWCSGACIAPYLVHIGGGQGDVALYTLSIVLCGNINYNMLDYCI